MVNRREFLKVSAASMALAAAGDNVFAFSGKRPLGVQLYTVRDQAEKDLPGVLAAIKKIGYQEVELYWDVYTHSASELRKMISDAGLKAPSGHFNYDGLPGKLDYAKELGLEWVVCPMLPESMRNSLDDFKKAAHQFNVWGEEIHKRGMRFGFHNHNYEFHDLGGTTGFDALMQGTDPKLVAVEMDCYWITQAGRDPLAMFKHLGKRIKMLHLKDRKPGFAVSQQLNDEAGHFTEVGSGTIDWKSILEAAKRYGVEHLFVERDSGDLPALESIRVSHDYLKKIV